LSGSGWLAEAAMMSAALEAHDARTSPIGDYSRGTVG
jgi:hypothetical protein